MDMLRDTAEVLAKKPGFLGELATRLVGESDRLLNEWVVSQLSIAPGDNIFGLGCGSGAVPKIIASACRETFTVSVDNSAVAINQAWSINKKAIREGRIMLLNTDFEKGLPTFNGMFSKAFSVNFVHLLNNPVTVLTMVGKTMIPGAKIVLAAQPHERGATAADAISVGKTLRHYLAEAGFTSIRISEKDLAPVVAVSVTGIMPEHAQPDNPEAKQSRRKKK